MSVVKILETIMLICFGAAWPFSIVKSWKARIAKVILSDGLRVFLLIPYLINFAMVACDVCLYFRNAGLDRENNSISKT